MKNSNDDKIKDFKVDYSPLFKQLKEKHMNRYNLELMSGANHNSMDSIGKGKPISMKALLKICMVLDCEVNDVMLIKGLNKPEDHQ